MSRFDPTHQIVLVARGLALLLVINAASPSAGQDPAVASPSAEARRLQGEFKRADTADDRRGVSERCIWE